MPQDVRLTTREVGESIHRQFGGRLVPDWKLRRVVDSLESQDTLEVQRIGNYRTITTDGVVVLADELRRLGWLESEAGPCK